MDASPSSAGGSPGGEEAAAAAPPKKKLTKAERRALEEKRARAAAREAAKRGPKVAPKLGKFVADREKADEQLRITNLFKEFADRGKIPSNMLALFVKDLFGKGAPLVKGAGRDALVKRLVAAATDALKAKLSAKGGLTAGDFTGWYFEAAWPMILEAREEEKNAAARAAEATAAAAAAASEQGGGGGRCRGGGAGGGGSCPRNG